MFVQHIGYLAQAFLLLTLQQCSNWTTDDHASSTVERGEWKRSLCALLLYPHAAHC